MPQLDVTDLLFDQDLADTFSVQRRQQAVNSWGETTTSVTVFEDLSGAVYPTGNNSLVKQAAFETQAETITVVTTFRLRGVSQDSSQQAFLPDLVLWQGNQYLVSMVNDYSQYGQGFIQAECASTNLLDQASQDAQ